MERKVGTFHLIDIIIKANEIHSIFPAIFLLIIFLFSLANESLINRTNVELSNIEALCYENPNMTSVEEHLRDLLVKLNIQQRVVVYYVNAF
jgi:hypothetical protein